MSALWVPESDQRDEGPGQNRSRLRSVPSPAPRLARFPFLLVLIGVFGVGMAGLLMLNTTLQNQAFESRTLTRQATELAYQQADLERQLAMLAAPQELARRASGLGLRPNPYPALVVLPGGKVLGKPTPVSGQEVRSLIVWSPAEIAAQKANAAAVAKARAAAAQRQAAQAAATKQAAQDRKAVQDRQAAQAKLAGKKPVSQPNAGQH